MRKQQKCKKCGQDLFFYAIVDGKRRRFKDRVNCFDCSPIANANEVIPYKPRYKTRRNHFSNPPTGFEYCTYCESLKLLEAFSKCSSNPSGVKSQCKDCINQQNKESRKFARKRALDSIGGKCIYCNYSDHPEALEFHHKDPSIKDKKISKLLSETLNLDKIKDELNKCVVLCAICHRLVHAEIINLEDYK